MKRNLIAAILLTAAVAFSCTTKEEKSASLINDGSIVYNPTATIADFVLDGAATKTVLSIDETTCAKFTFVDGDALGVYPYEPEQGDQVRFIYTESADAASFVFDGSGFGLKSGQSYAAYYPADVANAAAEMMTEIPVDYTQQRQAAADDFDISEADYLVSNGITPSNGTCEFEMSHVGALLVMDVTFAEAGSYTELTLTSDNTPFITTGTLDLTASEIAIEAEGTAASLTLALGEEGGNGLAIAAGETVRFCMMVPPVNLKSSTVTIALKDNEDVDHTGSFKNGNFKAGQAYLLTASVSSEATPEPTEPTDLSELETANCYIVDVNNINPEGYYFDASVAGNGAAGVVNLGGLGTPYPAENTYVLPLATQPGIEPIWVIFNDGDENGGCVSDVAYDATTKTISFKATGKEGNAKIALHYNAATTAVWTWHIWCTDQPSTITYSPNTGNSITIMDRNLGATVASMSEVQTENDIPKICGLYYQWGRPIPFRGEDVATSFGVEAHITHQFAFNYPTFFMYSSTSWWFFFHWGMDNTGWTKQSVSNLWGNNSSQAATWRPVSQIQKTIYDPCPPGYQVAPADFMRSSYSDTQSEPIMDADNWGIHLTGSDGSVFFPYNGKFNHNGGARWSSGGQMVSLSGDADANDGCSICLWSSGSDNGGTAWMFLANY